MFPLIECAKTLKSVLRGIIPALTAMKWCDFLTSQFGWFGSRKHLLPLWIQISDQGRSNFLFSLIHFQRTRRQGFIPLLHQSLIIFFELGNHSFHNRTRLNGRVYCEQEAELSSRVNAASY